MLYTKPRGTEDLFDSDAEKSNSLIGVLNTLAKYNGYKMIQTPIFESSNLYVRSVGNTSDIVQKEFYSFMDKGNREMVLRPEGTAGVIRAIIENKLLFTEPLPLKVCYSGPMFRYERPQSGRLRQFTQFGVECIGTDNIYDDIDVFMFAYSLISIIGLKQIEININNIGSIESRSK
jgi:histidyl-tRNA synthetase